MFDFEEGCVFPLECSLRGLNVEVRVEDFSLTNELTLGTMSGSAKLVLSVPKKGRSPILPSLVPCVSVKRGKSVEVFVYQVCCNASRAKLFESGFHE